MRSLALTVVMLGAACGGTTEQANDLSMANDLSVADLLPGGDLSLAPDLLPNVDAASSPPDLVFVCPARPSGEWHVSPTGSDTPSTGAGNGSSACPVKTIARAAALAQQSGESGTIFVHHQAGATPTTYGTGCTGGAPCDTTTHVVAATGQTLVVEGTGATAADVVLTSDAVRVMWLSGAVTVRNLTVAATGMPNGMALFIDSGPITLTNLVVNGVAPTNVITGTRAGVWIGSLVTGDSVTIGPGVTVDGGVFGVFVDSLGVLKPTITLTGTPTAPTLVRNNETCVSGATHVTTSVADTQNVRLSSCGASGLVGNAAAVKIDGLSVTSTGAVRAAPAISWSGAITNVTVTGATNVGIDCVGCKLTYASVSQVVGSGIRTTGSADLFGLVSAGQQGDGIVCDGGTLKLREANVVGNAQNGLLVRNNCVVDLGSSTVPSQVRFNQTSNRNGGSALCIISSTAQTVEARSTWSCGFMGGGCVSGTPTTANANSCQTGVDVTIGTGITFSAPNAVCCNN